MRLVNTTRIEAIDIEKHVSGYDRPALVIEINKCLQRLLQLGAGIEGFNEDSRLLGELPELDSMAVLGIITGLEEHFGFEINDDEISAESFETVGSLVDLVVRKLAEQRSD